MKWFWWNKLTELNKKCVDSNEEWTKIESQKCYLFEKWNSYGISDWKKEIEGVKGRLI